LILDEIDDLGAGDLDMVLNEEDFFAWMVLFGNNLYVLIQKGI
jgi:hypothetical protein